MVICPDCGKEGSGEKFCRNCGAYLPKVEEISQEAGRANVPVKIDSNIPNRKVNYCSNCGYKLNENFKFCPNCGYNIKSQQVIRSNDKSMLLAIILSVILPGLGQIYLGLDNKGGILLIAYIVSAFLILLFIGIILVMIIWIWALVDTIISMNALERGDEVKDKLF